MKISWKAVAPITLAIVVALLAIGTPRLFAIKQAADPIA